jgi:hypothetical protein
MEETVHSQQSGRRLAPGRVQTRPKFSCGGHERIHIRYVIVETNDVGKLQACFCKDGLEIIDGLQDLLAEVTGV